MSVVVNPFPIIGQLDQLIFPLQNTYLALLLLPVMIRSIRKLSEFEYLTGMANPLLYCWSSQALQVERKNQEETALLGDLVTHMRRLMKLWHIFELFYGSSNSLRSGHGSLSTHMSVGKWQQLCHFTREDSQQSKREQLLTMDKATKNGKKRESSTPTGPVMNTRENKSQGRK